MASRGQPIIKPERTSTSRHSGPREYLTNHRPRAWPSICGAQGGVLPSTNGQPVTCQAALRARQLHFFTRSLDNAFARRTSWPTRMSL